MSEDAFQIKAPTLLDKLSCLSNKLVGWPTPKTSEEDYKYQALSQLADQLRTEFSQYLNDQNGVYFRVEDFQTPGRAALIINCKRTASFSHEVATSYGFSETPDLVQQRAIYRGVGRLANAILPRGFDDKDTCIIDAERDMSPGKFYRQIDRATKWLNANRDKVARAIERIGRLCDGTEIHEDTQQLTQTLEEGQKDPEKFRAQLKEQQRQAHAALGQTIKMGY